VSVGGEGLAAHAEAAGTSRGFGRTLTFGAIAALGVPVALCAAQHAFGSIGSTRAAEIGLGLYWVTTAAGALAVAASSRRARVLIGFAASLVSWIVLLRAPSLSVLAVALTLVVALVRSGVLMRQGAVRGLVVEMACGACSLGLAYALYAPTVVGAALSLWGWFLVQSCFYLLAAIRPRRHAGVADPFDVSRSRLLELLGA
jgi:hypothetical protein